MGVARGWFHGHHHQLHRNERDEDHVGRRFLLVLLIGWMILTTLFWLMQPREREGLPTGGVVALQQRGSGGHP